MDWKSWLKLTPVYDFFGKRSYSQSGEDVVVDSILNRQKKGFYVDIGAFHPKVFSNTYLFYKRGWRGVCVEPNPEAKWKFEMVRPRDTFVNVGVTSSMDMSTRGAPNPYSRVPVSRKARMDMFRADLVGTSASKPLHFLKYFVFDEGATNTFSAEVAEENKKVGRKLVKTIQIPVMEINSLLKKYVPQKQKIDLLSIDVEGMDEQILKSIDWKKWSPEVVVCEEIRRTQELKNSRNQDVEDFLGEKGYKMVGMTGYSVIYKKSRLKGGKERKL